MTDLATERLDAVAIIEICRPPANYFDLPLITDLVTAYSDAANDGARAIILASAGKHFCAGADFGSADMNEDRTTMARRLYTAAAQLFESAIPVIAAVQGAAVGGGLGLACSADFRVASPSSRLHANFSKLGFHQGFGLSVTLPELVGTQAATDLLYTSRRLTGDQAHAIGLVDRLTEPGYEREEAIVWAQEIAAAAPLAVRSIRRTLRGDIARRVRAVLDRELAEQTILWSTEDCKTAIASNLVRTEPIFQGR
ncbi:enoyl-CoA hydratase/isomerase family protein [Nocardia vaccinii]|uniref:enoyl-CoA hydratase/isomerase family protein n=1 Tax=Nocardia vaccinii TaxID=1822 RepID=UPI000834D02E|nr:enoyl-CoA hydratase/isomerase family protein [Nocardia vaccinii]